jgi:methyl-accepting chemotaxis protein
LKADTGATTAIKTTLDTYQKDFNAYVSTVHDFDELCAVGGPLVQSARKVNEAADTVFVNAREAAAAAASAATMFVIVFILVAVGVGVGVALTITRSITGPVTEVVRVMKDFAAGKLDSKATTKASGELQEMIHTLNKFGDGLQTIIKDVGNVTGDMAAGNLNTEFSAETPGDFNAIRDVEQMNSGMQQISSASQEIARGAQETSGTVNESAKEIKDTNAMLQQVQSNAEESNKFAMESAENAKEMSAVAKKSGEGMIEIQAALGNTVEVIKALGNSIEQIGTTTEMIESIADQTNLLALNAAIEAARAGEHGRGFAVVAEEVRKLAENSKQSTAEIGSMITSLHEEMEKVTKATDTVTERAGVGREDLEKVVASVEKTAGLINKIKDSMTEVTEGARQGAESIEKVSKGVDEIASSAEESASSSEESSSAVEEQTAAVEQLSSGMEKLSEISDQAAEMIGKFKLKETRE